MIRTKPRTSKYPAKQLTEESKHQQEEWKDFWKNHQNIPSVYRYNLTICDQPKFIWFRNAKVGTRTILTLLNKANIELSAEHAMKCYYPPDMYKDYFKFAFVRNPWDRFVSGWRNKVLNQNYFNFEADEWVKMKDFSYFIQFWSKKNIKNCDNHFQLQSYLIDLNEVDFVGRFEQFEEDLKIIFKLLELPIIKEIPHKNKSTDSSDYRTYYNEKTKAMIEKMYKKDIQLFNYKF